MARDEVLEAIERARRKSTLRRLIESPRRTIEEKRYILYVISAVIAASAAAVSWQLGLELTNIGILAAVLAIMPPGFYHLVETSRIRRLEAEFPTLLRDISLSVRSGMTPNDAVRLAAQGQYGALTPALKHIDSLMTWGISFEDALRHFADSYPTLLIRRTVATIIEASRMGGEMGNILESVATDVGETKTLERTRSSETKPYLIVCYLSYFVFLGVVLVLSRQFLPMIREAAEAVAGKPVPGGLGQFAVSEAQVMLYERLFFHALVIQGFFAGIITGKIGEGAAVAGLKHSVFFIAVAVIAYTLLI